MAQTDARGQPRGPVVTERGDIESCSRDTQCGDHDENRCYDGDAVDEPGDLYRRHMERKRRSLVPPWVVGTCVSMVLPVAVALAIFLPWFLIGIQPRYATEGRMTPVRCLVVNHTIVATRAIADNMMLVHVPGLVVSYSIRGRDRDRDSSGNGDDSMYSSVAMPRIERARSWMGQDVMDDYFSHHAVNATATCYYDCDDPTGTVAMHPGIDGTGTMMAYCVSMTLLAYFTCLCVLVIIAGPCLCF